MNDQNCDSGRNPILTKTKIFENTRLPSNMQPRLLYEQIVILPDRILAQRINHDNDKRTDQVRELRTQNQKFTHPCDYTQDAEYVASVRTHASNQSVANKFASSQVCSQPQVKGERNSHMLNMLMTIVLKINNKRNQKCMLI